MFALVRAAPAINRQVFRIVLGAALIAAGLALHLIMAAAVGGLLLVIGIARGVAALTCHTRKGQLR